MAANGGTWSSGATRSTGTIARVYCLVHNEANNRDFFICYDVELVPGSRERCVFDVIFVKMERLQAIILSKEQNEVELEGNLKVA
ncbi:hypothetical protein GH714_007476 [Hevea brasiliensis]|uniref:Uncharacterized protein n=1 Tax=Hevea brasiliensis TaxID=3981 RepID=A0A6A6LZK3_HEVBR|nr:hypothetical protein GH714_007476 [Hevea brasiliensis]